MKIKQVLNYAGAGAAIGLVVGLAGSAVYSHLERARRLGGGVIEESRDSSRDMERTQEMLDRYAIASNAIMAIPCGKYSEGEEIISQDPYWVLDLARTDAEREEMRRAIEINLTLRYLENQ